MSAEDRLRANRTHMRWSRIYKHGPGLHRPQRIDDIGWDLEAAETRTIRAGEQVDIPTNIRLELPQHTWVEVRARSSIAKRNLQVEAGTIDPGYRGPIFVLLRNHHQLQPRDFQDIWGFSPDMLGEWEHAHSVTVHEGERIGQLVFHKVCPVWAEEVPDGVIQRDTDRGEGGFGSTNISPVPQQSD